MTWTRQQKVGKPTAKGLLLLLGVLCDDDDQVRRTQGFIADILECSRTTLKDNLQFLEDNGYITREKRNGGAKSLPDVITLTMGDFTSVRPRDLEAEEAMGRETASGETEAPMAGSRPLHGPGAVPSSGREPSHLKDKHSQTKETLFTSPTAGADEPQIGPTGYPMTAQGLLGEWIDNCTIAPMPRVKGHMAREIKNCIEAGAPFEAVRNGVIEVHQKGLNPGTLQSVVHALLQSGLTGMAPTGQHRGPAGRATGTQRAMQALQAGANLQAAQSPQLALEGTEIGSRAGLSALGEGSTGGQPPSGRNDDSGMVGNPRPFVIQ